MTAAHSTDENNGILPSELAPVSALAVHMCITCGTKVRYLDAARECLPCSGTSNAERHATVAIAETVRDFPSPSGERGVDRAAKLDREPLDDDAIDHEVVAAQGTTATSTEAAFVLAGLVETGALTADEADRALARLAAREAAASGSEAVGIILGAVAAIADLAHRFCPCVETLSVSGLDAFVTGTTHEWLGVDWYREHARKLRDDWGQWTDAHRAAFAIEVDAQGHDHFIAGHGLSANVRGFFGAGSSAWGLANPEFAYHCDAARALMAYRGLVVEGAR